MGRGSTLVYGKVTLSSEVDSLDRMIEKLDTILSKWGYPEKKQEDFSYDSSAPNAPKTAAEVKEIVKKASPAEDSFETLKKEVEEEWAPEEDFEEEDVAFQDDDKA